MKRNRTAGHNFERKIIKELKQLGFKDAVSSRSESRNMDDKKVDICNTPGWYFQCKTSINNPQYDKILHEMPDDGNTNVILHQKTKKANKKFMPQGDYVVMKKEDFYKLLQKVNN